MKTAVEWLMNELFTQHSLTQQIIDTFEHAKEMEKEQIKDAYENGVKETNSRCEYQDGEQYYNETFKSEQCK
jgi:hypothetical protein